MWRVIHIKDTDDYRFEYNETPAAMFRCAVNRSQGQLFDLTIEKIGDNNLLNYIVDRSSDLSRLTILDCIGLTGKAVVEAVKKLPHLEELHLIFMPIVLAQDIINMGIFCPILKSFTLNWYGIWHPIKKVAYLEPNGNEYVIAIAKSMPNLCHLRLINNPIDNRGLEANLESLDLRQCFDLDLRGALGKRCSQQIKHLKVPFDYVSFNEYERAPRYEGKNPFESSSDIDSEDYESLIFGDF